MFHFFSSKATFSSYRAIYIFSLLDKQETQTLDIHVLDKNSFNKGKHSFLRSDLVGLVPKLKAWTLPACT